MTISTDHVKINGQPYQVLSGTYSQEDIQYLGQRILEGDPKYSDLVPESIFAQDSWHDGYGKFVFRGGAGYYSSISADARVPHVIMNGPLSQTSTFTGGVTMVSFTEYNGSLYAVGGRYCYVWNTGTSTWDLSKDFGAGKTALKVRVFQQYLLVAMGSTEKYWYYDGTTWVQSTIADGYAVDFAEVNGACWKGANFVAGDANRTFTDVKTATDITNAGAWSSQYKVGAAYTPINALVSFDDRLYITKSDGLYGFTPGTSAFGNVMKDWSFHRSTDNGLHAVEHKGYLMIPILGYGLIQFSGSQRLNISQPNSSISSLSTEAGVMTAATALPGPAGGGFLDNHQGGASMTGVTGRTYYTDEVRGDVVWLADAGEELFVAMRADNGNYYILSFRDGVWHPILDTGTAAIGAMWVSGIMTNPRLWYSSGTTIKYFILPRRGINPLNDSAYRFTATGNFVFSETDANLPNIPKAYLAVALRAKWDSTAYPGFSVDVTYSVDGASSYTALGNVTTPGDVTLYFPTSTQGKRIRLKLTLHSNNAASSPQVMMLALHQQLRPVRRSRWAFGVRLAGGSDRRDPRTSHQMRDDLLAARDGITPIAFTDRHGDQWTVFVERCHIREVYQEKDRHPEMLADVTLLQWSTGSGIWYVGNPATISAQDAYVGDPNAILSTDAYVA